MFNISIILIVVGCSQFLTSCDRIPEPALGHTSIQDQTLATTSPMVQTIEDAEIIAMLDESIEDGTSNEEQIGEYADVISVEVSGSVNHYQFSVGISSPDTGCEQYADWWEVLSEDGVLIYRRILIHSHVNEQPFTRSGGPIDIDSDKVVIIRAHMNETGYGGTSMIGSVDAGFVTTVLLPDFALGVEDESPLPTGCNF